MKAKLKKDINGEYFLEGFIKDIPRQINVYQQISETKARFGFGEHTGKLSKQNCDELFGVVDIEKLAFEHSNYLGGRCSNRAYKSYKEGFNKAMELNKDKVFTLEDMRKAFDEGCDTVDSDERFDDVFNRTIQSLQQPTEIEVEIEMEDIRLPYGSSQSYIKSIPKLDPNGCLILKRV
jgi:hypothetical protein